MSIESTELRFRNDCGDDLVGTLCRPGIDGPAPAVLLCQGLSGVRHLVLPEVAGALARAGFASLRFDYAGYGDSGGERGWIDPSARVSDARYALEMLVADSSVDRDRLGVYGHSLGGPVAICVAASERRIRAAAAVSGPGAGGDLLRAARAGWEWVALRKRMDDERAAIAAGGAPTVVPIDVILPFSPAFAAAYAVLTARQGGTSALAAGSGLGVSEFYLASIDRLTAFRPDLLAASVVVPTLLVNGSDDDTAPVETVEPVFRALAGPKRWVVVPGADHNALDSDPGLGSALAQVTDWFARHL